MSYTKASIFNLALSSLQLGKQVINTDTDTSNEVRVLNMWWDTAFESTLKDLDLDRLSSPITLELITELTTGPWKYVYKYPTNCVKFRRIVSGYLIDNNRTHIAKRTGQYLGGVSPQDAIFTDQYQAVAECIPKDISLVVMSPMAALAISKRLAILSGPLIVGKGSAKLKDQLEQEYIIAKFEAQQDDAEENFNYEEESIRSEFVAARME